MKVGTNTESCKILNREYNALVDLNANLDDFLEIKIFSEFQKVHINSQFVCAFLEEKIYNGKSISQYFNSKHFSTDKLDMLAKSFVMMRPYLDAMHKLHYIHGDIAWGNIIVGQKIRVNVSKVSTSSNNGNDTSVTYSAEKDEWSQSFFIDYGTAVSKHQMDDPAQEQKVSIKQTYNFAHPFFYQYLATPDSRRAYVRNISNDNFDKTKEISSNRVWNALVQSDNYAFASVFVSILGTRFGLYFDKSSSSRILLKYLQKFQSAKSVFEMTTFPEYGTTEQAEIVELQTQLKIFGQKVVHQIKETIRSEQFTELHNKSPSPITLEMLDELHALYEANVS